MKRIVSLLLIVLTLACCSLTAFGESAARGELRALLNENYDSSLYTEESYSFYQKIVNKSLAVFEKTSATDAELNAAAEELKSAKNTLVPMLDRDLLLSYAETIEDLLHGTDYKFSEDTITLLTAARTKFLSLYQSETLTVEEISEAKARFDGVMEVAESSATVHKFSKENAEDNVIISQRVITGSQGVGTVTYIRLILIGIGALLLIVGITASVLYLKPPKFLR